MCILLNFLWLSLLYSQFSCHMSVSKLQNRQSAGSPCVGEICWFTMQMEKICENRDDQKLFMSWMCVLLGGKTKIAFTITSVPCNQFQIMNLPFFLSLVMRSSLRLADEQVIERKVPRPRAECSNWGNSCSKLRSPASSFSPLFCTRSSSESLFTTSSTPCSSRSFDGSPIQVLNTL